MAPIQIYNSLKRKKVPFEPIDPTNVTWYACGPTVYDDAHLGHARNYVSTDIIRRILTRHFKYPMTFVMNITDVDDKIILAARQEHFVNKFAVAHPTIDEHVRSTTLEAFNTYIAKYNSWAAGKNLPLLQMDMSPNQYTQEAGKLQTKVAEATLTSEDDRPKARMNLNTLLTATEALNGNNVDSQVFYSNAEGVLRPYLDNLQKGSIDSKDHTIFDRMARRYEDRFFEDMDALNVLRPDKTTRVTEYSTQIIDCVKQIQSNGFAYESSGSVWYDIKAWEAAGGTYARLQPENRNDEALRADGEGALTDKAQQFGKRSEADFALWKRSKEGEPSWRSPWGDGRPGWHIECSAMASDVIGSRMDIHSGGIDLAFPHHDNELAQSEAFWSKCENGVHSHGEWVNYFLHMGHLHIQGAKMSKSLKNFTTIRAALREVKGKELAAARRWRIVFLRGAWRDGLEVTPNVERNAVDWEEKLNSFFLKALDVQKRLSNATAHANGQGESIDLTSQLQAAKAHFDEALRDSFNTPDAMKVISDLITEYNKAENVSHESVLAIAEWITDVVTMFGLDAEPKEGRIGWSGIDIPEDAKAYVYPLSALRDSVRQKAIAKSITKDTVFDTPQRPSNPSAQTQPYAKALEDFRSELSNLQKHDASPTQYLDLTDQLRNVKLWDLGIYLDDRENLPAMVRPLNDSLKQERLDRESRAAEKEKQKTAAASKREAEEKARLEKGKVAPEEMFKTKEFSEWDEKGFPLKDAEGKEIAKSRAKKLKKEMENQEKLHARWKESTAGA
ncbi:cysteinyl-tRNA synthetase [Elasticomyces elasticus]|nr:cysteinyl-tRNA synthetase [Elasticomyces elasticus]